jgi:isopenicillin N synthase-like dioxygenase
MRFGIIKSLLDTVVDMQSPDAPRALRSACETYGFFYLTNHGVEQRLVDQVCWGCEGLLL